MTLYFLIFSSQLAFNIFKVLEIKYTYENKTRQLLLNSVLINIISLLGVYYSLDALENGDFVVIVFYLIGSVIGKYIGMKFDNPLKSLWQKITNQGK